MTKITDTQMAEVADAMASNELHYDLLKLAEECTEVAEVCIKMVTKAGGPKEPPRKDLISELGDLVIRLTRLAAVVDPDDNLIEEAVEAKLLHLWERRDKYPGKL